MAPHRGGDRDHLLTDEGERRVVLGGGPVEELNRAFAVVEREARGPEVWVAKPESRARPAPAPSRGGASRRRPRRRRERSAATGRRRGDAHRVLDDAAEVGVVRDDDVVGARGTRFRRDPRAEPRVPGIEEADEAAEEERAGGVMSGGSSSATVIARSDAPAREHLARRCETARARR